MCSSVLKCVAVHRSRWANMATSGSLVEQVRIGREHHGFVYQRVPQDVMQVQNDNVVELWIGKRGWKEGKKLVLVKYGNGQVIAWDMKVCEVVANGVDQRGWPVRSLHGKWSHARWFGDGQKKWQFDPGSSTEDPLTPGKNQWNDLTWEVKVWHETTVVGPEAREEAKRRRVETECIVVPQHVLVKNVVDLEFTIFWS